MRIEWVGLLFTLEWLLIVLRNFCLMDAQVVRLNTSRFADSAKTRNSFTHEIHIDLFDFYGQTKQAIHTNFWLATHCSYSYSLYLSQSRSRALWINHKGVILRLREHYNYRPHPNVFSLSTPGGRVTPARSDRGGGYPSQVWGGYPGQVLMVRMVPRPGPMEGGVPQPGLTGGVPQSGPTGGTPARSGQLGTPLLPGTGQHMEYLVSGGRYASCFHAGGLSCYRLGTANSNTVNSKFHLIRSFNQDFAIFLSFHV